MPDPIQTICSRLPGAVYNQNNDTCRYTEQGNQVLISRNRNGVLSITAVGNSTAALCIVFNDPNVDLPSIPEDLWNFICE